MIYVMLGTGARRRTEGNVVRTNHVIATLTGACLAVLLLGQAATANILISINKSTQRMTVTVDGQPRYTWPVSTGKPGYDTPNGTFRPFRMDRDHRSEEWDNAPMPYSIFFTMDGNAVHGTYKSSRLGRAVSHGCVRLSVQHAAMLWALVTRETMGSTVVQISGAIAHGGAAVVAGASPQDRRGRQASLFPFSLFGQ